MDELDVACARLLRSAFRSAAVRVLLACAHRAACLAPPWELPRPVAACLLVLYCHDHPVRRHFQDAAGTAKAVHPDAALAHHQDDLAARCSDDRSAGRRPGACLAAHRDVLAQGLTEARRDAMENVAMLKVQQQGAESRALLLPDATRWGLPVLLQAAAARQVSVQTRPARRRDVQL